MVLNADQANLDGDALGDACDVVDDRDGDADGVNNTVDNCPAVANADQADKDQDDLGDVCDADADGDAVADAADNCPGLANAAQTDTDADKAGDDCDSDRDGDGTANAADECPLVSGEGANGCPVAKPEPVESAAVPAAGPTKAPCASRRQITWRLSRHEGRMPKRASVYIDGVFIARHIAPGMTVPVDLRGLPQGSYEVTVMGRYDGGALLKRSKVLATCAGKSN
jgi:hypothetical protein